LEGVEKTTGYDDEDPHGFNFYPWAVTNLEAYQALFKGAKSEKMLGESSTMYQYMPDAPERIKQYVPNVKLIAVFRNPADRLYSRYLHLVREHRPPTEKFEDCFDKNTLWWKKNDLIQEGFYYTHMKRYFDLFDAANIKIMLYEDLRTNPIGFMQEIFQFLAIDEDFEPNMGVQFNVSGKIKNKYMDWLIGQQSIIRKGVERISPNMVEKARSSMFLQKIVTELRKKNLERVPLNPVIRQRLIDEIYSKEIKQFGELIQRDLSHWLAPKLSA